MRDYAKLAAAQARKHQIALYAPDACKRYRTWSKTTQAELGYGLGVSRSVICKLEAGEVQSWRAAEAVLILNQENLALLKIAETPGLRDLLLRWKSDGLPINVAVHDEQVNAR